MRKSVITALLGILAVLAVSALAAAAPANKVKLGGGTYSAKWEATGSGALATQTTMDEAGCQPGIHDCYDTLIEVTEPGTLAAKTTDSQDPACKSTACDTDLQVFTSDSSGEPKKELQESAQATPTSNEAVSVKVTTPGFYVVRVDYAICANCTVPAEATLKPSGAITPPGTGVPGDAVPAVTAKKPGAKKVKTFKGTASDDKGIAKVEAGIIQLGKKNKCKDLAANGKLKKHKGQCTQPGIWLKAKGTTAWTLKLKKPLKKGKYVLFARATDSAGQTQGGYGPANMKKFTVKK
jgi:hypothetical protein